MVMTEAERVYFSLFFFSFLKPKIIIVQNKSIRHLNHKGTKKRKPRCKKETRATKIRAFLGWPMADWPDSSCNV